MIALRRRINARVTGPLKLHRSVIGIGDKNANSMPAHFRSRALFVKNPLPETDEADTSDFIDLYARLLTIARSVGHRDSAAEDRVQEACLRLLEAGQATPIRNRESYFKRILRNLRIDGARRAARDAILDDDLVDPQPGPDRAAQARRDLALVAKTLETLPPRCRNAFELHRFGNLSYAEIAQRMGISISMVEKHIAEAVLRLATALGGR